MAEPRRRVGSVRVRTTVGATAVAGVALLAGSILMVVLLRGTLTTEVNRTVLLRAAEVVTVLSSSVEVPVVLPVAADDEQVIQVLDADGTVVAASANVAGLPPVVLLQPGGRARVDVPIDEDPFLAIATAAPRPDGDFIVLVARSLDDVNESAAVVTRLLALGLPALLAVVAFTTWRVVGRALAPVEAIRAEVDEISGTGLHRRVPGPGGGDEIARLAETMNRMLGRLEDAHMRQRRFVSDASHELRSPVASIRQHAEVALAHPGRTTVSALAQTVLAEDLRVQRLAEDLLLLARADERTLAGGKAAVDLDDLVFDEARRLRDTTPLQIDTAEVSAGRVRGDAEQLRRLLRNLGDNAARHARARVAISLAEHHDAVLLCVDDDGAGIPVEQRRRIFERFVRLDEARARDYGGAGLGLAIVDAVTAAHGGTVAATSGAHGGTRFEVRLPRLAGAAGDGPA